MLCIQLATKFLFHCDVHSKEHHERCHTHCTRSSTPRERSHTHTAHWSSTPREMSHTLHNRSSTPRKMVVSSGQLKALSDVMSIQVAATLLPFLLQPISYNTPSSKVSLKSLGLSLSRLVLVDRRKALLPSLLSCSRPHT